MWILIILYSKLEFLTYLKFNSVLGYIKKYDCVSKSCKYIVNSQLSYASICTMYIYFYIAQHLALIYEIPKMVFCSCRSLFCALIRFRSLCRRKQSFKWLRGVPITKRLWVQILHGAGYGEFIIRKVQELLLQKLSFYPR